MGREEDATREWETDWSKCPVEGWVWVADSDGQVLMMRGAVAKHGRATQWDGVVDAKYAYGYVAYMIVDMPEHPASEATREAAEDWYGRTW